MLNQARVLIHPFVVGELALGNFRQRELMLNALRDLPQTTIATDDEALFFIERHDLFGIGIGYIDAHLLAAVEFTRGSSLMTHDKRLAAAAKRLSRLH